MCVVIRAIQFQKWSKHPNVKWMKSGEMQADALRDIRTTQSALSVYLTCGEVSFSRIVAALAAKRDKLRQFHYVDFDRKFLESKGFSLTNTPEHGTTFDETVNAVHHDIVDLTPQTLYDLAQCFLDRISKERLEVGVESVACFINCGIDSRHIDEGSLKPKLVKQLRAYR